jgi:uncharacterized protein with PIN domain
MADHMVIKLGKYLRVAGFDAEWDLGLRTHELIKRANAEGRVFLTRNRHLGINYPVPREAILLESPDPLRQLQSVTSACGLDLQAALFTHCIRCNVALAAVSEKAAIRDRVHPNVYARHERFFTCPRCGTVFWRGSHVRNTCRKLHLSPPDD